MSDSTLIKALINSQKAINGIKKTKKGVNYTYAPLDSILPIVTEELNKNGVLLMQHITVDESGMLQGTTILIHESGEKMEFVSRMPLPSIGTSREGRMLINEAQNFGSASTYLRRYMLMGLLGLATEDDDDGAKACERFAQKKSYTPPVATPAASAPAPTSVEEIISLVKSWGLTIEQENDSLKITGDYNTIVSKKETIKKLGFKFDPETKSWVKSSLSNVA